MQNSQSKYYIIKKVKKLERERQIGVIKEDMKKAILKLKNDKTAHEYEIRAKHIKRTGGSCQQNILKQILEEG